MPLGIAWIDVALAHASILLLRAYRALIGIWLPPLCRFEPTCSRYAEEAFRRYGAVGGSWRTIARLSRCHPFHPGGLDPLR